MVAEGSISKGGMALWGPWTHTTSPTPKNTGSNHPGQKPGSSYLDSRISGPGKIGRLKETTV